MQLIDEDQTFTIENPNLAAITIEAIRADGGGLAPEDQRYVLRVRPSESGQAFGGKALCKPTSWENVTRYHTWLRKAFAENVSEYYRIGME